MATRRKIGAKRHPNGRIAQPQVQPVLLLTRRAALVGKDHAKDAAAARALGVLKLNEAITATQCLAAEHFEKDWRAWKAIVGAPAHHAQCGERDGGSGGEIGDKTAERLRRAFDDASEVIRGCHQHKLVWSLIETVVMDDAIPLTWNAGGKIVVPDLPLSALRRGLDALMRHYRLKEPRAA